MDENALNWSSILKRKLDYRGLVLFAIALLVIALDQYTKALVRKYLPVNTSWNPIAWLDRIVTLTHVHNTGAAFGLFPQGSYVFMGIALIAIAAIVVYHRQLSEGSRVLQFALGLQLGGATGNLIDRLVRGYVTDFIDCRWWPVFNVSDSSLVVGSILLAFFVLFLDRSPDDVKSPGKEMESDLKDIASS